MNVHLLVHLPHFVRRFGPLWTHSAFAFEDSIGHLVKKSHGTHDIAHQVEAKYDALITCDHIFGFSLLDSDVIPTPMASTCEEKAFAGPSNFQVLR